MAGSWTIPVVQTTTTTAAMSCPSSSNAFASASPLQHVFGASSKASTSCPRIRHLVSGTFNSRFLHILSFDTLTQTLSLLSTLPAYGPHSFLTQGRTAVAASGSRLVDTVYATTWAEKKELCAWKVNWGAGDQIEGLEWLGNQPITATSSYVHVQPPPFAALTTPSYDVEAGPSRFLYSAGGPTGEVHSIDPRTGALLAKEQELIFLKGGEKDLAAADKTRKALRYGAHNVDIGRGGLAFIADVGRNAVLTYMQDPTTGRLDFVSETELPEQGDGPRHVVPSPCGRFVYCVSEHTSYVDVFAVREEGARLQHLERVSILPPSEDGKDSRKEYRHLYRGDTVRLSPDGKFLFATTRGMHVGTRGFVKVWQIDHKVLEERFEGLESQASVGSSSQGSLRESTVFETRNSGGKANAIEFAPRYGAPSTEAAVSTSENALDYAVLTDDEQGFITVLTWDGHDLRDASTIQLPALDSNEAQGASQAIWLS